MTANSPIRNRKILWTAFLALCFTVMVGFSPILHNHEFDLDEVHQDCSPCHFSHSNAGLIPTLAPLSTDFALVSRVAFYQTSHPQPVSTLHSGRSPPFFS